MVHAVFVLVAVLTLAPVLAWLPMASLAALLLVVAWNMSEARHFVHMLQTAPKSDIAVLLTCFGLTVVFDMVVAVGVGIVLAAMLFMKRMADITDARVVLDAGQGSGHGPVAADVLVYEIGGPLFFGAAMSSLGQIQSGVRVVIVGLEAVPVMDVTGRVALESAVRKLQNAGTEVILAGARPQPLAVLAKAGWTEEPGRLRFASSVDEALGVVALGRAGGVAAAGARS